MRHFISSLATCGFLLAAPAGFIASTSIAVAQNQQGDQDQGMQQVALTAAQIENYIAAQQPMGAIIGKLPEAESDNPSPATLLKLDAAAKANKFASFQEYQTVGENISLVMSGIDPKTKSYVGAETVLKQQIADVQADKTMGAKDKKDQLEQLNEALSSAEPVKVKANIDLVVKYYDKLLAAMPQEG
jgi:hypothetical protein